MSDYAFRAIEDRREIEKMWSEGKTPREISQKMGKNIHTIYDELARGRDGSYLPNRRLRYSAEIAQERVEMSLRRRGKRGV